MARQTLKYVSGDTLDSLKKSIDRTFSQFSRKLRKNVVVVNRPLVLTGHTTNPGGVLIRFLPPCKCEIIGGSIYVGNPSKTVAVIFGVLDNVKWLHARIHFNGGFSEVIDKFSLRKGDLVEITVEPVGNEEELDVCISLLVDLTFEGSHLGVYDAEKVRKKIESRSAGEVSS